METWIETLCKMRCRRVLRFWGIVVGVMILALPVFHRYVLNFISGPYTISAQDLPKITDPDKETHYFIRLSGDKTVDTGLQEFEIEERNGVEQSRHMTAGYFALLEGDKFVLVKSDRTPSTTVTGAISTIPADVADKIFQGMDGEDLRMKAYPFFVDTTGFRTSGYWAIGIGVVILLIAFAAARPSWRRLQDISTHPVVKRVREWGDLVTMSQEIESELQQNVRYRFGLFSLTDKYVVQQSYFSFNVLRFWDLVWAYKIVTQHRTNFIPTGKTYSAKMVFYGAGTAVQANEAKVNEMLGFIATRAPWAIIGFSKELQQQFSKDQKTFLATVEARRREVLKPA
ncbi:MAG: DUF6709 family protein [Candidatus Acidiferrales bacterium]